MNNISDFIKWYYKDDENFFITCIENSTGKTLNFYHNVKTCLESINRIQNLNNQFSIYFTINSFKNEDECVKNKYDLVSKCKDNVSNIKAIMFDFDDVENSTSNLQKLIRSFEFLPTYILETSPKKFQVCYVLDDSYDFKDLREFELINKTLAKKFDSDINVCSIEKVFRMPFMINQKNQHVTRFLKLNLDNRASFLLFKTKVEDYIKNDVELKKYYDDFAAKHINKVPRTVQKKVAAKSNIKTTNIKHNINPKIEDNIDTNIVLNDKLKSKYFNLLKYNKNDASICDIHYIKSRARKEQNFDIIFNEILALRDFFKQDLKRDIQSYYEERKLNFF